MNNKLHKTALIISILVGSNTNAACPQLSSAHAAYYLAPIAGAANPQRQGDLAMIYSRPIDLNLLTQAKNLKDAAILKMGDSIYPGVETNKVTGTATCHYTVPQEWKERFNFEGDNFDLQQQITEAPIQGSMACPVILASDFEKEILYSAMEKNLIEFKALRGGGVWSLKNIKRPGAVKRIAHQNVGGAGLEDQSIIGERIIGNFTNFQHTCTYALPNRNLELNGTMSGD
jgi:hypothetical protein